MRSAGTKTETERASAGVSPAIKGQPVTKMDDLLIYLEENTAPGQTVQLTILRGDSEERTVAVTLGQRPANATRG